jgi:hypothetical protein
MKSYISTNSLLLAAISLVIFPVLGGYLLSAIFGEFVSENFFLEGNQISILFALVVFFLTLTYIFLSMKKNDLWELRRNELLRGRPVNFKIDLSKVKYAYWCYLNSGKYLILKLDNESFFSLDLFALGNGKEIMQEVEKELGKKILREPGEISKHFFSLDRKSIKRNCFIKT